MSRKEARGAIGVPVHARSCSVGLRSSSFTPALANHVFMELDLYIGTLSC